jgi:hypothetical protein
MGLYVRSTLPVAPLSHIVAPVALGEYDRLSEKLVLTYDNTAFNDAAGAQLQRIYGIYSVSRLLGASYLHTPLGRIGYQGLSALEEGILDPDFNREFNELLPIESDVLPTDDFHEVKVRDLTLEAVEQLVAQFDNGATGGRPTLARVVLPYLIADAFPDCYEVCKAISPFESSVDEDRVLRVALHVRRGEIFANAADRLLPNSFYVNAAHAVADVLEGLGREFQIELWTELPTKEFAIRPDDDIFNQLESPVMLNADMSAIEDFDELPNLVPRINGSAIDCLRGLATADVLLMSRSSFSYVSGLLNKNCVAMLHPFWHRAPSSWIEVGLEGQFDRLVFEQAVAAL